MTARGAWLRSAVVAGAVIAADQASKALIEHNLVRGERVEVLGPVELTNVVNTGIAFGLAGGGGAVIIAVTVAAIALILALFARDPVRPGAWVAIGLLIGGAFGNLIDRAFKGAVTDFIDFPVWPAFNVADTAITIGVAVLAWSLFREPRKEPPREPGDDDADG